MVQATEMIQATWDIVGIGVNANREIVDKFCYLGDILSVDGGADAAVETKI